LPSSLVRAHNSGALLHGEQQGRRRKSNGAKQRGVMSSCCLPDAWGCSP